MSKSRFVFAVGVPYIRESKYLYTIGRIDKEVTFPFSSGSVGDLVTIESSIAYINHHLVCIDGKLTENLLFIAF